MYRNKKSIFSNSWYIAWQTLKSIDILWPVIGFAIGFVWLLSSVNSYIGLLHVLRNPAIVQVEIAAYDNSLRQSIEELEGVEAVTRLSQTSAQMQWGNYTGNIQVYGVETDYMEWLADTNITVGAAFSEGMPYGIISADAAKNLQNQEKTQDDKLQPLILTKSDLMTDSIINGGSMIRLYGLIESQSEEDKAVRSETETSAAAGPDGLSGLYLAEKWYNSIFENSSMKMEEGTASESANEGPQMLLVVVNHGYQVKDLLEQFKNNRMEGQSSTVSQVEAINEKSLGKLGTGSIIFICSMCVLIYQEKLWKVQNKNFLNDIQRFDGKSMAVKKLFRRRRLILCALGLAGSLLWSWISVVFEWI